MAGAGRKSKYDEFVAPHLTRIEHLCRMGATEAEICGKLGVAVSSLKRGKVVADDAVEAALYRRAVGYTYDEVKVNSYVDNNQNQRQFRTVTTKEIPPDVTAAIFWLKNRRPEKWRDRHEFGFEGNIPVKLIEEEKDL